LQGPPDAEGKARVLHSPSDYKGGAGALADALRKADPNYQPDKDPDQRPNPSQPPFVNE
jgi:hypothetical protein